MTNTLKAKRVLIVGASAGIGRATGELAAADGARVAFAARRGDVLDEIVADLDGCVAVPCDVTDPGAAMAAVDESADALGGLDAVVYVAGVFPIGMLDEMDSSVWQDTFDLNVFGAAAVTRAAAKHLKESGGRLVFISSNAPERPWPGMVVYAASKAALDSLVEGWNHEHPDVGATRVVVGPTNTSPPDWDMDLAMELHAKWASGGYLPENPQIQEPEDVAQAVCDVLRSNTRITDIRVVPPGI
ncbi:MAG: SDR family NAD(P)-dependent oxidoreductase [Acidimicrobiales bacterium]|nr:SDR family NAD(P)-dependent oxidoreductase [Acidimicrobiales bacterium]